MGRLIHTNDLHNQVMLNKRDWGIFETTIDNLIEGVVSRVPTVEAIPKADYEARLKSDMVAMLEDLDLKIDEMYEPQFSKEGMDGFYWAQGLFKDLVQEQINALKEKDNDKL